MATYPWLFTEKSGKTFLLLEPAENKSLCTATPLAVGALPNWMVASAETGAPTTWSLCHSKNACSSLPSSRASQPPKRCNVDFLPKSSPSGPKVCMTRLKRHSFSEMPAATISHGLLPFRVIRTFSADAGAAKHASVKSPEMCHQPPAKKKNQARVKSKNQVRQPQPKTHTQKGINLTLPMIEAQKRHFACKFFSKLKSVLFVKVHFPNGYYSEEIGCPKNHSLSHGDKK